MADPFARLAEAWTITLYDELIVGFSGDPLGYVAPVFTSEREAARQIAVLRELSPEYYADAVVARVGNPWPFMRRAAGQGCSAIAGDDLGGFQFMTRVEDSGQPLPNVLRHSTARGAPKLNLTVAGVRHFSHAELTHWERYDIIDALSAHELRDQTSPFRDWQTGDPFWEIRGPDTVLLTPREALVGDWISLEGAFALFSTREYAEEYLATGLRRDNPQLLLMTMELEGREPWSELSVEPVEDLRARAQTLATVAPVPIVISINPRAPRFDAAWGTTHPERYRDWMSRSVSPGVRRWRDLLTRVEGFWLRTVRGLWTVRDQNSISFLQDIPFWTGRDTIRWSKGQSIQLLPLSRSFARLPPNPSLSGTATVSEADIEEWLAAYLDEPLLDSDYVWDWAGDEPSTTRRWDGFVLHGFDSVSGEAGTTYFTSVLDALRFLWQHENEVDRPTRELGVSGPGVAGKPGSGNPAHEDQRSEQFRRGLLNIGRRILKDGYQPREAENIVALSNAVLERMHIDYAGYTRDLFAAAANEEELLALSDQLDISEEEVFSWRESLAFPLDPEGAGRVRTRIGDSNFDLLERSTQGFLSTALHDWHERGFAPQLDYAPISMEVVKALELELGGVFKAYRATLSGDPPENASGNKAEEALVQFLRGGKTPMLGTIQQLLYPKRASGSALEAHWRSWLASLSNAAYLTSEELNKALYRVANDYRNRGVHDSPIDYNTCQRCIEELIGRGGSGIIVRVAVWSPQHLREDRNVRLND